MADKHAALYIRVSTDAQREEGYSIEAQEEMLTAYCVSRSIRRYKTYIDGGFSGSNIERPAMTQIQMRPVTGRRVKRKKRGNLQKRRARRRLEQSCSCSSFARC